MEDKRRKGRFNNHVHLFTEELYKLFVPFMFAPFDKLLHLLCIFLEYRRNEGWFETFAHYCANCGTVAHFGGRFHCITTMEH